VTPIEWLQAELNYSDAKHGDRRPEHDVEMANDGVAPGFFWADEVMNYVHRANVLGLDNPLGRQAIAKGFAVYEAMLESVERVYGPLPEPGVPSGVLT